MMRIGRSTLLLVLLGVAIAAEERQRRQAGYDRGYGGDYNGVAPYRTPAQQQYQPQPQQYQQQQPQQQVQHYPPRKQQRPQPHNSAPEEEEKEQGPHPLQQLLEKSKFECGAKNDGYYADGDVGCQAFHYCISGQKHSMMCPSGTVFHQVHLNCVPSDQDICSKADKFFFVNDYLNKPLEQKGPNNTIQYHQRYYPDNYAVGDPFIPPQESQGKPQQQQHQPQQQQQSYGHAPAYQQQHQPQHQQHQPQRQQHQPQHQQHQPQHQQYQPQHKPQSYAAAPPKAPFTPQVALYGPPRQAPLPPKPTYQHQPQPQPPVAPYVGHHAHPRPVHHQPPPPPPQSRPYQPAVHNSYDNQHQSQAQALQAHRAAEQAVLAKHYQAQQVHAKEQSVQPQAAPPQYVYGAAARERYGQQY